MVASKERRRTGMGAGSLRGGTSTSTSTGTSAEGPAATPGRKRQGETGGAPAPGQATRGRAQAGAATAAARLRHEPQRRVGQQPEQHAHAEPGGQLGGRAAGEEECDGQEGGRRRLVSTPPPDAVREGVRGGIWFVSVHSPGFALASHGGDRMAMIDRGERWVSPQALVCSIDGPAG